jgi:SAM-dependent methyltransferase
MEVIRRQVGGNRLDYNDIYSGAGISQMDSLFIWILRRLGARHGRLLDVSCGEGQMVHFARRMGLQAHGVDISDVAARITTTRTGSYTLVGDAERLPYADTSFDYVTNIGSLEHYEDMPQAVREMTRVLRPGGRAAILLPNSYGKRWNVQHVWRTGDIHDDGQPLQRYGTRGEWQRLLEGGGLRVTDTLGYEYERAMPYTWPDALGYLRRPQRILSTLYYRATIPVNAASMLIFVCVRDDGRRTMDDRIVADR